MPFLHRAQWKCNMKTTSFNSILRIAQPLEIIAEKEAVHVQPEYQKSLAGSRMFWKNSEN